MPGLYGLMLKLYAKEWQRVLIWDPHWIQFIALHWETNRGFPYNNPTCSQLSHQAAIFYIYKTCMKNTS